MCGPCRTNVPPNRLRGVIRHRSVYDPNVNRNANFIFL
jgi:hypothetical protein